MKSRIHIGRTRGRTRTGAEIAELRPALFLFLIIFLFPMFDLLYIGSAYCAGWYLNHLLVRESSLRSPSLLTSTTLPNINGIIGTWQASGLGHFTGGSVSGTPTVAYLNNSFSSVPADGAYNPQVASPSTIAAYATCTTKIQMRPFLTIHTPLLGNIPGLSAPLVFTYFDQRPQEDTGQT